jgi:guanylate kinase
MRDKIVCLVGASGSGKTTIAKELEKAGYNVIQSYTTRPPREPNEWGHIFIELPDGSKWTNLPYSKNDLIAYTIYDGYEYFALKQQYQGKGTSIYVIDVAGVNMLREKVKDADIMVIYIQADKEYRKNRMIRRYNMTHSDSILIDGKMEDLERRMDNDYKAFKIIPCDYVVDNNGSLEEAVQAVKNIMEGETK